MRFLALLLALLICASDSPAKEAKKPGKAPAAAGRKHFLLSTEVLTPMALGTDVSLTFAGHHNLGVGFMDLKPSTLASYATLHPRYRYYLGRKAWDVFMQAGWSSTTVQTGAANGTYLKYRMDGVSTGIGYAYLGKGFLSAHIMLSMVIGEASQEKRESRTDGVPGYDDSSMAQVLAVPLAGFGVGIAF